MEPNRNSSGIIDGCFIRIQVIPQESPPFSMMIDGDMKIEYVAKQISAELVSQKLEKSDIYGEKALKQFEIEYRKNYVCQLYDNSHIALRFGDKVRDVLIFDDQVFPVTTSHSDMFLVITERRPVEGLKITYTEETTNEASRYYTGKRNLHSILYNSVALQFFIKFCLEEFSIELLLFWIESEVFKSIKDPKKASDFAKTIINTYIEPNSPLCLNLEPGIRDKLLEEYKENSARKLDEIQEIVYSILQNHAYVRYEQSPLFQQFLEFEQNSMK